MYKDLAMKNELGLKIVKSFSLDKIGLKFLNGQKIADKLSTLHGGADNKTRLYKEYLGKKIEYLLWGIVCIAIFLLIIWLMPHGEGELLGNVIARNGYDEVEKSVVLIAGSEGMETEIEILIEPRHYTKEQLNVMANEVFESLAMTVFTAVDETEEDFFVVKEHLRLPLKVETYPFSVTWESSNYNVIDSDGTIQADVSKEGEMVCITARLNCYEYSWEREYVLQVFPAKEEWKEIFSDEIEKTIEELDYITSEEETFVLPEEVDGHLVVYKEKTDNSYGILIVLGFVCLGFIWIFMDSRLTAELEERNNQLLVDYAKVVSKLSLYLSAGLSFRTAISRITKSADKNRFYTRELEVAVHELENGIAEHQVIENFAKRCQLPCYIKLSVLLNQNMKKGNSSLQKQLKEEVDKAFEDRKNLARKYAEEAGTKLLVPMVLMLVVVMVMIMYPAFVSFAV